MATAPDPGLYKQRLATRNRRTMGIMLLVAAAMLGLSDPEIARSVDEFRAAQTAAVPETVED